MAGSGSGPLGLLLMIAPLAAIPVFAIIGVPQFAPVSASQADEDDAVDWNDPPPVAASTSNERVPKGKSADDLFAPVTSPPPGAAAADPNGRRTKSDGQAKLPADQANNSGRWLPPPDALDQWEVRPDAPDAVGNPGVPKKSVRSAVDAQDDPHDSLDADDDGLVSAEGFNPDLLKPDRAGKPSGSARSANEAPIDRTAGSRERATPGRGAEPVVAPDADSFGAAAAEQAGWQSAARRLKELGIRKYRLESQIEEQAFVFTCMFASPDNPRVVRRFEADAETPLEAVELVLQQIEEWRSRGRRSARSDSPADSDE